MKSALLTAALLAAATLLPAAPASPPAPSAAAPTPAPSPVENSVVKVFTTARYPDVQRPWTKQAPSDLTGSGVVIDGHHILTNAHVVVYASQVQVQSDQAGDKIPATVEYIAPGIDLALLKLADDKFFDTHRPVPLATALPSMKDTVLVYGFPLGGNSLSITKGIVSRIEFTFYSYPVSGLRVQIDAAVNPGNSGGPALAGDKMIGLASSILAGAQNISYIIPSEEIAYFLRQASGGKPYVKPAVYDPLQTVQNPALKPYLKLKPTDEGIAVIEPDQKTPGYPLQKWDVISKIGDTPVDDQGMVHQGELRLDFHYYIQREAKDGKVSLEIIRGGQRLSVSVPAPTGRTQLIPWLNGTYPKYFVYGPIVFSPASGELANSLFANGEVMNAMFGMGNPLITRRFELPAFPGEELVTVAAPFLPHPLVEGYDSHLGAVVSRVNGIRITSMKQLVAVLRDATGDFIAIDFAGNTPAETLVLPRKKLVAATDDILSDNGIREQGSPEYLAIWIPGAGR